MQYAPSFITTSISQVVRASPNAFTGIADRRQGWQVTLTHSYFAGESLNLFFPTEAQAREYGEHQVYKPTDIIERAGASNQFGVKEITEIAQKTLNPYTGLTDVQKAWKTWLDGVLNDLAIDWTFPTEEQARGKFGPKKTFTVHDLFGTLVAVPEVVAQSYIIAAQEAKEREEQAKAAAEAAALAKKKAAALKAKADAAAKAKAEADAAAKAKAAAAAQAAAQAAAAEAARKAALASMKTTYYSPYYYANTAQYVITNGGAAGYYDNVYYAAGQFAPGKKEFYWAGSYRPA